MNTLKKRTVFTMWLALYGTALLTLGMFMTFFNDAIQKSGFFADIVAQDANSAFGIDKEHLWGQRHYWYFCICMFLFVISVIRIIMWADWYWDERIGNKKTY